jgi:hypothetical protein
MTHRHFFIAGAQRCATTFFYGLLDQHPEIAMARPLRPEPKYFIRPQASNEIADYRSEFFPEDSPEWLGEKSTSYIEHPLAAQRIAGLLPDAEVFFLLRDPVERAISNYNFSVMNGLEPLSLQDALDAEPARLASQAAVSGTSVSPFAYATRGFYARYLEPWFAAFPARQIHLLTTEELIADPHATTARAVGSLGLQPPPALHGTDRAINQADPAGDAPEAIRRRLRSSFVEANRELAARYGVDIRSWQ